jgi:exopolysaccharide biosynthesis predicted pyruvyltransferase EpsI
MDLIEGLRRRLDSELGPAADARSGFALLDFPTYSNLGDSAIWLGALAFFDRSWASRPAYVSSMYDFSAQELRNAVPVGPVFLTGGGNFGDIWPRFQRFRLSVIHEFPDRRIVQLPQSVMFRESELLVATQRAIAKHSNFLMYVRDLPSFEFSQRHFDCEVRLAPDLAFYLGPFRRSAPPLHDVLFLLRTDKERADTRGHTPELAGLRTVQEDWISEANLNYRIEKVRFALARRSAKLFGLPTREEVFRSRAAWQLRRGLKHLCRANIVVTDRLHGHILSLLLDVPNALVDNSYGKVRNFVDLWTKHHPDVALFNNIDAIAPWVRDRAHLIKNAA